MSTRLARSPLALRRLFFRPDVRLVCLVAVVVSIGSPAIAVDDLRSQAVVAFTFDEESGEAADSATVGETKDAGSLVNGASRVDSPFWNQAGKRALLLDAGKKQIVQVADGPDVDRPDGVTLSFFYLSLHELTDAAFHGVIAKRAEAAAGNGTNYGINYLPKNDAFQVYINDGTGFAVAAYSVKDVVNVRRLVHLTATFETADAPAADADADVDDVRIRLFANGKIVKPKASSKGFVNAEDAWITDVKLNGLLNDVPLTIGSSTLTTEYTSGLYDELLIFSRALTIPEVGRLFVEVAGTDGAALAAEELKPIAKKPTPRITAISLYGLRRGRPTRVTIDGQNLGAKPVVQIPGVALQQTLDPGTNANRMTVDVAVPSDAPPGFYPLRVLTEDGVSNALVVAIDSLPQLPLASATAAAAGTALVELPAAFSGVLSGASQARVYFQGKKGQRLVADVEAQRLGAKFDPVVEIKTERGTPLTIEWGKYYLKGDARAELVLPADGLYYAEVHDLTYKAPGGNPMRIKLGDLGLVDAWFPPAASMSGETTLYPVGTGLPDDAAMTATVDANNPSPSALVGSSDDASFRGPAPPVQKSSAIEIVESGQPAAAPQEVDARFAEKTKTPVFINGRISAKGEEDVYTLKVASGGKLNLSLLGRAIDSPIDAVLEIRKGAAVQTVQLDRPGSRDPNAAYTVPANTDAVTVHIRDLHGRGGRHYLYRLKIEPAGTPDFDLKITSPAGPLTLPETGAAVVTLQLTRRGYGGPVDLQIAGDPRVSISPKQIPAGGGNRTVLATLTRDGGDGASGVRFLHIVGNSTGIEPAISRAATITPAAGETALAGFSTMLPVSIGKASGFTVSVAQAPPALFKGAVVKAMVTVTRDEQARGRAVRLSLVSTEVPRPVDPKDAKKGNKPLVRAADGATLGASTSGGPLEIVVPSDVAQGEIEFVLKAEVVPHAWSNRVVDTVYSLPFRLPVQNALELAVDDKSLVLTPGKGGRIRGTIKRAAGFAQPVEVAVNGLPTGFKSDKVLVSAESGEFEIPIGAAPVPANAVATPANIATLRVTTPGGGVLLPDRAIAVTVAAPEKPEKPEAGKTPTKKPAAGSAAPDKPK